MQLKKAFLGTILDSCSFRDAVLATVPTSFYHAAFELFCGKVFNAIPDVHGSFEVDRFA